MCNSKTKTSGPLCGEKTLERPKRVADADPAPAGEDRTATVARTPGWAEER